MKTLSFTGITSTAKGILATTTSETHNKNAANTTGAANDSANARKRASSSVGVSSEDLNVPLRIIGCINEDGLGLVSWWRN